MSHSLRMRWRELFAGTFALLLIGGCGGSNSEPPAEKAGDLREAHDRIEGELLLNEVEEWTAEYAVAHRANNRSDESRALREVHRAAHACWEFGVEECSEIRDIESAVNSLEEEAHRRIPFTHPWLALAADPL